MTTKHIFTIQSLNIKNACENTKFSRQRDRLVDSTNDTIIGHEHNSSCRCELSNFGYSEFEESVIVCKCYDLS